MNETRTLSPRAELRLVAAFVITPPAAAVVMFVIYLGLWYGGARTVFEGTPIDPIDSAGALALGVGIIAVVVTIFGAVPSVTWLIRRGPLSLRKLLVLGAALGNAPFAAIVAGILVTHLVKGTPSPYAARLWFGLYGAVRAIALGLVIGMVSATVFWAVAIRSTERERPSDS
jgi:hypothetical protein